MQQASCETRWGGGEKHATGVQVAIPVLAVSGLVVARHPRPQLTKYIEQNPNEAIRLSAFHLKDLRDKDEYGAGTDKQLFTLYAADTRDVREKNETYGDDSAHRGGDIKARGENWDRVEPHIDDTLAWDALSEKERVQAIDQIESQTPAGHNVSIDPIYDTAGMGGGTGTGRPEPGTPSPSPNLPPTPPKD